ncbi:DNA polymerase-like [Rutidosis leptorrhynchoides]|uniref:DNA polymerase-like n=1 Tax=Rutidosis leptorrhynchoides TaxID=125765 RepID=UPI003A995DF4
MDQVPTEILLNRVFNTVESTSVQDLHQSLIIATHNFREPEPLINDVDLHTLLIMDLLNQFAYPSITTGYAKFGILITIRRSYREEITFSIGPAIPLTDDSGCLLSKSVVYSNIYKLITKQAEIDDGDQLVRVTIRVYLDQDKKKKRPSLDEEDRYNLLNEIIEVGIVDTNDIIAMKIQHNKRRYLKNISPIDVKDQNLRPFIVSDLETLLDKNQFHKPYAAGLLMVFPGKEIQNWMIETWYSEDYSILYPEDFEKRSKKVLIDLVLRITALVKKNKEVQTIYFHNFSRFDGIILLKHLACNHKDFHLKPLMRNHRLYELAVYSGKKMLFRFRDSLNLLHGSLNDLAKSLCPDFGTKGSINYDEVTVDKLPAMKDEYIDYMKHDIYLLGGVMQKAQEIYSNLYKVDIESKITLSALSLSIFRMKYFDDSHFSIHIPNRNEDQFIRHGYYGGHTDAYKPHGKDLYFYDVNSLYPFIMKEFPMPHGAPVCEELKFAREIGYTVIPLSGYLFEKKESPFSNFVSNLFESRLEAKKSGNDALSYVYTILMNSLYGRFGINPQSTKTEIDARKLWTEQMVTTLDRVAFGIAVDYMIRLWWFFVDGFVSDRLDQEPLKSRWFCDGVLSMSGKKQHNSYVCWFDVAV